MSLERVWYGDGADARVARAALRPAELAYALATGIRGALYERRWLASHRAPIPVLSIGNVSVGGTGKTPITAWAVGRLRERGARPAVVMRGYGGDEPLVHELLNPGVPVVVDANRLRGVTIAQAGGADCAVLDDAFQHRRIARTADWVLVAAERFNDTRRLLPAGPLREPVSAVRRAHLVVVTRKSESAAHAAAIAETLSAMHGVRTVVAYLAPSDVMDAHERASFPASGLRGRRVTAVAAIGAPEAFFAQLGELGLAELRATRFPDHHAFTAADIERIGRAASGSDAVVCTLKDAVKLAPLWPRGAMPLWYVSQRVEIERGAATLDASLATLLDARARTSPTAGVSG